MGTLGYFLLVIGPLIFIHELGHFLVAKWRGVRVERFSLGFPPRLFGFKRGDTDYCVSAVPLGGYVKMAGENPEENVEGAPDEYTSKSPGARALIIIAGPAMNYLLAFALYVGVIFVGGDLKIVDSGLQVGEMTPEWPAQAAGLLTGDWILAIDGEPVADFEALKAYIGPRGGEPITLTVLRGADTVILGLTPRAAEDPQSGVTEGKIGIYPMTAFESVGLWPALKAGAEATWQNTVMVGNFFFRFVSGRESPRNIGGPLFIASIAGQVAEQGWRYFIGFMAILSINLAILNVLPIPALDGGQLLFLLIERIKGKPLSLKQRIAVQQVGLAFLFVLIIFVTINDIVRVLS
jgi:regulator of sigma E protease